MKRRLGFSVALLLSLWAGSSSLAAPVQPASSRIIDRTVICKVAGVGYPDAVRFININAEPFRHFGGAPFAPLLFLSDSAASGEAGVGAWLRTGRFGTERGGYVSLQRPQCRDLRVRVPLTGAGLTGGGTGPFGDRYRCIVPATIVIRVRAEFKRPTTIRPEPRSPSVFTAKGQMTAGYVAVSTQRRRLIAFASAHNASGKARLFVARDACTPNP